MSDNSDWEAKRKKIIQANLLDYATIASAEGFAVNDNGLEESDEMELLLKAISKTLFDLASDPYAVDELVEYGDWGVMLSSKRFVINIEFEEIPNFNYN